MTAAGGRSDRAASTSFWLLAVALPSLLAGCMAPAKRYEALAADFGMERTSIQGDPYPHVVYSRHLREPGPLHIYIDGDGMPWMGDTPAADPTPRHPLMLKLMDLDTAPAIYLGRPCYHGYAATLPCKPSLWTSARYSAEVVHSLEAAVRRLIKDDPARSLAWFGYSGGGVLAALLAARFPRSIALVTVGSNLDTAAWASHARQDLGASLNPASVLPRLPPSIAQTHLAGSDDRVVPPAIARNAIESLGGTLTVVRGYGHACCWEALWPGVLRELTPGR